MLQPEQIPCEKFDDILQKKGSEPSGGYKRNSTDGSHWPPKEGDGKTWGKTPL